MIRILIVANRRLPSHDYRVAYQRLSRVGSVWLGLPERPESADPLRFVTVRAGEGLQASDICDLLRLVGLLWSARRGFDVVHFYSTKLVLCGPLLARVLGLKSITTVTGLGRVFNSPAILLRSARPIYIAAMMLSTICSRRVLFQNRSDMERLVAVVPGLKSKAEWIGSGTDCEFVADREYVPNGHLRVLTVSRLRRDKGIPEVVAIAEAGYSQQLQFTLVGPSSGEPEVDAMVADAHRRGVLTYAGPLSEEQLHCQYANADTLLFLSHGEGLPRVVLEATSFGLCSVLSAIPAHVEVVGSAAVMLPVGTPPRTVVDSLVALRKNVGVIKGLAQEARRSVEASYSAGAFAARMDAVITSVCDR